MLVHNSGHNLLQINAHPYIFKSVAFKSSADTIVDEKVESFSNDLIALVNEKSNIKYRDIEELIRKTTGERVPVRPYGELEQNEQTSGISAFYRAPIGAIFDKNQQLKMAEGKKEIFVDLPQQNSSNEEKGTFIRGTVHEFTHFCQDKYNLYSKKDLMNTLVASVTISKEEKINTLNATQPARIAYINAATKILAQALRDANIGDAANIDSPISEYLNSVMSPATKCDISRWCRRSLNSAMQKVPQNSNIQYIKNYLFYVAKREEQANQNGSKAAKKYLKKNNNVGYDLFAVLYQNLADTCK